ncbi:hypothetical protein C8Q80DRAFT_1214595 [Daedaleopsis nitida]|nr:hypothetical protein C8Q80DRAFT_1214595 [Daedaleopsis nitida]
MRCLCTVLERTPVPFPKLAKIRLELVEREGKMVCADEALCARLGRALLQRYRLRPGPSLQSRCSSLYPCFKRLVVTVTMQEQYKATPSVTGIWSGRLTASQQSDAVLARWRSAFSLCEEAGRLELNMLR